MYSAPKSRVNKIVDSLKHGPEIEDRTDWAPDGVIVRGPNIQRLIKGYSRALDVVIVRDASILYMDLKHLPVTCQLPRPW